ncbi:Hsp20/alpha crystallin family protein [Nibricoccus sp. IMCC34717]|uniref:Hsp20/alpha crystallin family protein n=1 Tax=Nibricoccus sp. IMCC34717 TaxID=3034021 RepID=UPI00384B24E0
MKLIRYTPFTRQNALAPVARDPWSLLDSDLDRLFAPLFGVSPLTAQSEIDADENNYFVRLVLPGVKRDQLTLEWLDGAIEVTVKGKPANKDEAAPEYRRTLSVPTDVQADKIRADLADGILTLTLPKAESAKPRRIELN